MERENGDIFLEEVESRNGNALTDSNQEPKRPAIDLILEIAGKHRRTLIRVFAITVVLSLAIALLLTPRYNSTTQIMPPEGPNPAAMLAAVAGKLPAGLSDLAGGILDVKSSGPLWVALLRSRTILDGEVDRFGLMNVYKTKYRLAARKRLVSRTEIADDKKSGVISISVSDTDRARAQGLANGYVDELNNLLANVSTSSARRERLFIEQRLNQSKKDLESAEIAFGQFASKNSTFDLKEQTRAMVGAGAQLEGQIIAAQSELEALQQTYTDDNIRVRTVKARISSLKRELGKISGSSGTVTSAGTENSGTGEDNGNILAPGDLSPPIRQLPVLGVQWTDLYRRAKIQETVFELLTQQYELAKIQEAKEIPTVKVIDTADYPEKKSWPPRTLIVLLGPLLSLACAFAWLKLKDDWDMLPVDDPSRIRMSKVIALFHNHNSSHQQSS